MNPQGLPGPDSSGGWTPWEEERPPAAATDRPRRLLGFPATLGPLPRQDAKLRNKLEKFLSF